jgi:putative DNA primase/helicase
MFYQHTERYASGNLHALDARSIARALGGDVVGRDQVAAPGPGHSRKDRSLSVRLSPSAPDGFLIHSHAGDDWRECRDHVKAALGITTPRPTTRPIELTFSPPDPTKIRDALLLWNQGVDPRGTPVEAYLRSRRLELDGDVAGEVLRYHPRLRAMLALFRNIVTNEPQAISRTLLDHDARKRERKFLGPVGGAAIKLDADEDVLGGLHIGEGIETCVTARMLGLRPAWALGSAGAIAAFPVLNGVECLTIFREPDPTGMRDAKRCAANWLKAGRNVLFFDSKHGDLNDALKESAR